MASRKKVSIVVKSKQDPPGKVKPLEPIVSTNSLDALKELKRRGYDDTAALGFAKAQRSWAEKDSAEWKMWRQVEESLKEIVK